MTSHLNFTDAREVSHERDSASQPGAFEKVKAGVCESANVRQGAGLLNNELYIGQPVWNRLRYIEDPDTGKRVSRLNPASTWVITEVPELRIIDDELWEAVKARQGQIEEQHAPAIEGVREAHKRNRLRRASAHAICSPVSCSAAAVAGRSHSAARTATPARAT
jgi:hypothetical protein